MEQMLEDDDLTFRLIAPGKFVYVESNLNIKKGHYYKGSLFSVASIGASLVYIPDTPNFLIKKEGAYLSINSQWVDKSSAQEFAIIYECDDKYIGDVLPQNHINGFISSDGVAIDESKQFLVTLSSCWNASLDYYSFSSEPFREGSKVTFKQDGDILYPMVIPDNKPDNTNMYISVHLGSDDGLFIYKASTNENTIFFKEIRPGVFSANTKKVGRIYFEWVKASVCVNSEEPNSISDILVLLCQ